MRWAALAVAILVGVGGGWWFGRRQADGPRLAYVHRGDLFVASPGEEPVRITHGAGASIPQWSPDGRWLTYYAGRELWLASADGRRLERLVDETRELGAGQAAWSPREPLLAYISRGGLWVVRVGPDGPEERREVHLPAASFAWAPEGKRFAVEESAGGPWPGWRVPEGGELPQAGVVIVPLEGGTFRTLFRIPWLLSREGGRRPEWPLKNLAWSPDGQWITFHRLQLSGSASADMTTLMVVPAEGGPMQPVGEMLGYGEWVGWKPGEPVLTYVAGTGRDAWRGKRIMLADPRRLERQQQVTPPDAVDRGFAWSPLCGGAPGTPRLAVVRSGPESPKDRYDRPLPAIYLEGRQVSFPEPPFGDYAPHFGCQGDLSWVRIAYDSARVLRNGKVWVAVDVPGWYYGHWFTNQVLAWWEPGRSTP